MPHGPADPPSEQLVYFLKCGPFLRIGRAGPPHPPLAVEMRVARRFNPYPVYLLGTRPGDDVDALELRRRYETHHLRESWFRLEGELLTLPEFLAQPALRVASLPVVDDWVVDDADLADRHGEARARHLARCLGEVEAWCRTFDAAPSPYGYAVEVRLGDEVLGYLRRIDESVR